MEIDPVPVASDELSGITLELNVLVKDAPAVTLTRSKDFRDAPSGICYDARMRFHSVINPQDDHPEDPRRIYRIYRAIEDAGLTQLHAQTADDSKALKRIPLREVKRDEVLLVHDLNHWESMLATANMTFQQLINLGSLSDSMYFNNETAYCARLACGGAIETCRAVADGRCKNAIAVIRPPGHHAEPEFASGFCVFNNVSVAAKVTMQNFPETCKRILILDWDVHHGNGTQTAFYKDPNVLFISLHRYQNGTFYPGTPYGDMDKCGAQEGLGYNVNIPWSTKGMNDADYLHAFQKVVMPISREFNPDLVIISAGFDAAVGDPIGENEVTPAGYAHMTHMLMSLAGGKVVACLEGGYNLDAISASALAVTRTLMGDAPARYMHDLQPSRYALETCHLVALEQSKYWQCMGRGRPYYKRGQNGLSSEVGLHDVVRSYQVSTLRKKFGYIPLPLLEDRVSFSFENQAVSTPDFYKQRTLVVFIHDAPEVWQDPQAFPNQHQVSLHDAVLPNALQQYAEYFASREFGVIDVNVPATLTGIDFMPVTYTVADETARLARYLWDNYVELSDAEHIIFLATGESCLGIVSLISTKAVKGRVKAVINVYGNLPLRPLTSVEDGLVEWYYEHSLCLTTAGNECWQGPKKPKRKFGKAIRGGSQVRDELLAETFEQIRAFVEEAIDEEEEDEEDEAEAEIATAIVANGTEADNAM
jgi:histone deacetylase 6